MQPLFAQLNEAAQVGTEIVRGASQYDGSTFVLVLVLVAIIVLLVLFMWKVYIPDRTSKRESEAMLAQCVAQSTPLIQESHKLNGATKDRVDRLLRSAKLATNALEKIAAQCHVDLASELGQIHGVLDAE